MALSQSIDLLNMTAMDSDEYDWRRLRKIRLPAAASVTIDLPTCCRLNEC